MIWKIKGTLIVPGDTAYENVRRVWNAMIALQNFDLYRRRENV